MKAKQYRKKPIVIEAMLFDGTNKCGKYIENWSNKVAKLSKPWKDYDYGFMEVKTIEDTMTVGTGDYVIKGVENNFYACEADIFEATYEEVK